MGEACSGRWWMVLPLSLVPPMRRNLGVGVQGKPVNTGTAGTRQRGALTLGAKACANAPDLLAGPFPKGNTLLDGGGQGARELGLGVKQGIIPSGDDFFDASLQVSPLT